MQTSFYASGFLYSLKTHQILLLQSEQTWSTLGGESNKGEAAEIAFQRVINEFLGLNLKTKDIHPIYDYSQDEDKPNYVFYAEVKNPKKFASSNGASFSWVAFGEISKLLFSANTKQDVIVGERVINAKWRDDEARKTPLTSNY